MLAVKKDSRSDAAELSVQHQVRVEYAEQLLPRHPLKDFGLEQLVNRAREQAAEFVRPGSLDWLPILGSILWVYWMSEPSNKPDWWTPEIAEYLREVDCDYQVQEFDEEMARVNALPLEERRRYIAEMVDHARKKGVKFEKPALGVTP